MMGKSTMDATFCLETSAREVQGGPQRAAWHAHRPGEGVPTKELYWRLLEKNIQEKYIHIVQDMYKDRERVLRCVLGTTELFKVEMGCTRGQCGAHFCLLS